MPTRGSSAPGSDHPHSLARFVAVFSVAFITVVLALIFDPSSADVTLSARLLALYGFIFLLFAFLFFSGSWKELSWTGVTNPVVGLLAAFVVVTALSFGVAQNAHACLTDLFRSLAFLLIVLVLCLLLPLINDWPAFLLKCVVCGGALSVAAGVYEWLTEIGGLRMGRADMEKVQGVMSNVNLYASYLVLVLPFCLAGLFILRGPWRYASGLVAMAVLLALALLQSRSAYLGLLAGGSAAVIFLGIGGKKIGLPVKHKAALSLVPLVVISAFVFIAFSSGLFRTVVIRFSSIFAMSSDPSIAGRLQIWSDTLRMVRDHAWFGVGAGNFTVRLPEYFDRESPIAATAGWIWLTPHNDILGVLAEKGFIGLGFFVGVFVVGLLRLGRVATRGGDRESFFMAVFSMMSLGSILVIALFDFPLSRINHLVYCSIALSVACLLPLRSSNGLSGNTAQRGIRWKQSALVLGTFVALCGTVYGFAAVQQERLVKRARLNLDKGEWDLAADYARKAVGYGLPLDRLYTPLRYIEGVAYYRAGRFDEAVASLEAARLQLPSHSYLPYQLAAAYVAVGKFEQAAVLFEEVHRRHPRNPEVATNLATALISAGRYQEAADFVRSFPADRQTPVLRRRLRQAELVIRSEEERGN
jgi:O-antigen ligase